MKIKMIGYFNNISSNALALLLSFMFFIILDWIIKCKYESDIKKEYNPNRKF